ncbi:cupin domain-containing protein [Frankia sp. AgPm24]|uniref:Cupin domain-containing protein n=2 Tax=Frankiaceae TaxID=74712 RepID=A0ABT0JZT1_9ACTN|nr:MULTISPECIES: cupin domain-containing protein [Frankia]MCK9877046.1 cupin domain-containing protein [Frankia umida]MCK9923024.1 cupin domain-containing protein [Frankia sp. AgPm24]
MRNVAESIFVRQVLDSFDDFWHPRILAQVNDYDVRVAKVHGEYLWHSHEHTDEFFLVISGSLDIWLRENGSERVVTLPRGAVHVVPRGVEHRPVAAGETEILLIEPTGTLTVGDRHDEVPDHVVATTGAHLDGQNIDHG